MLARTASPSPPESQTATSRRFVRTQQSLPRNARANSRCAHLLPNPSCARTGLSQPKPHARSIKMKSTFVLTAAPPRPASSLLAAGNRERAGNAQRPADRASDDAAQRQPVGAVDDRHVLRRRHRYARRRRRRERRAGARRHARRRPDKSGIPRRRRRRGGKHRFRQRMNRSRARTPQARPVRDAR